MATFLQTSGAISMSEINTVFARGNDLNSYRGTTYYTASTGPNTFSSGAISFNNFYGTGPTSNAPVVDISDLSNTFVSYYVSSLPVIMTLTFATDGTLTMTSNGTQGGLLNGGSATTWVSPTASGRGNSYWILWTLIGTLGSNGSATASSGGRLAMSTARSISVQKDSGGGTFFEAEYDIEIWDAASGGTQVGYAGGFTMDALRTTGP